MRIPNDYSVGALAKATGLAVRTLHHWDEIGLLQPAGRTAAGHRRYSCEDVEIAARRELRRRLFRILDAFDPVGGPSIDELIDVIERTTMHDRYYTPEQLDQLAARRAELGDDAIRAAEQDWAELIAAMDAQRAAGTDPADPRLRPLAERWRALVAQFTGGDPGIAASLRRMYETEGPEAASRGMVSTELMQYASRAQAALDG